MNSGAESFQHAMRGEEKVREMVSDIYNNLQNLPTDQEDIYIPALSRFWRSLVPNAFTPQFVNLGPQHHQRQDVLMTDELKLAAIKRLHADNRSSTHDPTSPLAIPIRSFLKDLSTYDDDTLRQLLVDGLFLLTLLHNVSGIWYYFQSKRNNVAADRELTFGAIVGDVFMLDNQIPSYVLSLLPSADEEDLLNFCEEIAPFFHRKELARQPLEYAHLLDLTYHLAAPKPIPMSQPKPLWLDILQQVPIYLFLLIWTLLLACVYLVVIPSRLILSSVSSIILGVAPWLGPIFVQKEIENLDPFYFIRSVVDGFFYVLASFLHLLLFSFMTEPIDKVRISDKVMERTRRWFHKKSSTISSHEWTGSASQLHKSRFRIQPTEGGISSIEFDAGRFILYLPRIKLLHNISEVIIANLMAYELSTTEDLIFTRYIQLMTSLIQSVEDVNVLVNEGIILSYLQDDADVVQLFKRIMPVSEFINGPVNTNSKEFKDMTMKAKEQRDGIQNLLAIMFMFFKVLLVLGIAFVFNPFLVQTLQRVGCYTIFSPYLNDCTGGNGRHSYLVSSA